MNAPEISDWTLERQNFPRARAHAPENIYIPSFTGVKQAGGALSLHSRVFRAAHNSNGNSTNMNAIGGLRLSDSAGPSNAGRGYYSTLKITFGVKQAGGG